MPANAALRPQRIRLGDISVFVVRGPHKQDPQLWYWRARGPRKTELGARWATERDATAWAAQLLLGDRVKPQEDRCETVVDLLELYLHWQMHERVDIEESTRSSTKQIVKRLSRADRGLRTVKLGRLDSGALQVYARSARAQEQAPSTTVLDLKTLKAAWAWGRREGLVPDRPMPRLPKLKVTPSRPRHTPSTAQVQEVLSRLEGRDLVLLALQAELGARIGEVAALHAGDLEWPERWTLKRQAGEPIGDGWVTLGRHVGARKTGGRRVPLSSESFMLIEQLGVGPEDSHEALRRLDRRVFGVTRKRAAAAASEALKAAVQASGQPPWTSHGFRRAAVRRLIGSGQDASVAAELLGHSKQIMLQVYDDPAEEDLAQAAQAARLGVVLPFAETPCVLGGTSGGA